MSTTRRDSTEENEPVGSGLPAEFERALKRWLRSGNGTAMRRILGRELDEQGIPRRWPVEVWRQAVLALNEAQVRCPTPWPEGLDTMIDRLALADRRWRLPNGASAFEMGNPRLDVLRPPGGPGRRPLGPSTSHVCPDRPLAVLRSEANRRGDMLALDHRDRARPCGLALVGSGVPWIGPSWPLETEPGLRSASNILTHRIEPRAELVEWSFRLPEARVTRSALWLKGRQLALLAEQIDSRNALGAREIRLPIAPGISAEVQAEGRLARLSAGSGAVARVLPLALPCEPVAIDPGTLGVEEGFLRLRQRPEGRRCWLPLLFCWGSSRRRRSVHWRILTVSERSRVCPPEVAFAVRVNWGGADHYVIYRSLAKPGLRAFLGHQTEARFLVGLFRKDGSIEPLLRVD